MEERIVDPEITLVPYYPNEEITFRWYQDKDVCKQVDNRDDIYTIETLRAMYSYLSAHGDCYYIQYKGVLIGDITLRDNAEISIVICKAYQNRHIGRRCIKAMVDIAREKGFDKVKANIYSFNVQSKNVFKSVGFQQTDNEWYELLIQEN